jgi:hypothetical protein
MRTAYTVLAATAVALLASAAPASAGSTLKFVPENAACVANAWVPFNTDPASTGNLGEFIRTGIAAHGELAQRGCKGFPE